MEQITEQNTFLTSVLEEVSMHVGEEGRKRISSALQTATFALPSPPAPVDLAGDQGISADAHASHIPHHDRTRNADQELTYTLSSPLVNVGEEGYFSHVQYTDSAHPAFASEYHTPATTPHQFLPHTGLTNTATLSENPSVPNMEHVTEFPINRQTAQFHDIRVMGEAIVRKAESIFPESQELSTNPQSEYQTACILTELESWRAFVNQDTLSGFTTIEDLILRVVYCSGKISATMIYLRSFCDAGNDLDPSQLTMAITCVNAAQKIGLALPDQPNLQQSDEMTLWCSLIPHLVRAVSVFLFDLSAAGMDLQRNYMASFDSLKKLVRWLRALRQYDHTAKLAHTKVVSLFRAAANEILRSE